MVPKCPVQELYLFFLPNINIICTSGKINQIPIDDIILDKTNILTNEITKVNRHEDVYFLVSYHFDIIEFITTPLYINDKFLLRFLYDNTFL